MKPHPLLLPLLALALGARLLAQQQPQNPPPNGQAPAPAVKDHTLTETVVGKITEVRPDGFEICPWNTALPRRMDVVLQPDTQYFQQHRGSKRDMGNGDFVVLMHENTLPPTKAIQLNPKGNQPGKKPEALKAVAVLRFPEVKEPDKEIRQTARLLFQCAETYFIGQDNGGVDPPKKWNRPLVGHLEGLDPLVIRSAGELQEFRPAGDLLVVNNTTAPRQELRKDLTVFLKCLEPVRPAPPGTVPPSTADHPVKATLVCITAAPMQGNREKRKYILREEGKLKPSDTLK